MTYVNAHHLTPRATTSPGTKGGESAGDPHASATEFQPVRLTKKAPGLGSRIFQFALDHPYWIYAFLRRFIPILTFKNWAFIARNEDVKEVLARQDVFSVPFGEKIEALNDGPNFLLGMADGEQYRKLHKVVADTFPLCDNKNFVAPISAEEAESAVGTAKGRIDAIADLVTRVPTRVCQRYYGVPIDDEKRFAHITIAMSTFMFGDPNDDPVVRQEAMKAGAELRPIIDSAIEGARRKPDPDTIAGRLVKAVDPDGKALDHKTIRAILIGMITGFVPTNTMGGGHMVEMLLKRRDMMAAAQAAARVDDDELLKRVLWETFRFMPLNPGPFRECAEDSVIAEGTSRRKEIKKGTKMLVSTHSAMFDPRAVERPKQFIPGRPSSDNLTFGYGLHWCIGAPLAEAQIVQTLKPLLMRKNIRRAPGKAGKLQEDGPFPKNLVVLFDDD
jgi:cytochrome P450